MVVIGVQPRPRVLFCGFEQDDPDLAAMMAMVPTSRHIDINGFASSELRADDWDIAVVREVEADVVPSVLDLVSFGCDQVGRFYVNASLNTVYLRYGGTQPSDVVEVNDALTGALKTLVERTLVPPVRSAAKRRYLTGLNKELGGARRVPSIVVNGALQPFLRDADGNVIAGSFQRGSNNGGTAWALPLYPPRAPDWFAEALAAWGYTSPDWRTAAEWQTVEEEKAGAALAALTDRREAMLADLAAEEQGLAAALKAATEAAEAGRRQLLTAQGDSLVAATASALRDLGFTVTDQDAKTKPGEQKVEDLRVSDPDDDTWRNITEVRGYANGPKVSDLQRIARFAAIHLQREGVLPTSRWYVVNQFLGADPSSRPAPLAGAQDDVNVFAEDGGLVVDTRDLFRLVRDVALDRMTPGQARTRLREATGLFTYPAT